MKQLVFIHGAECFSREEDYILNLKQARISQEEVLAGFVHTQRWHHALSLGQSLGVDWQVIRPNMPVPDNAKYAYWKIWFEKHIPYLHNEVVLVGHSLGAMFLSRYLSENKLPVKPSKLFLLAAAFTRGETKPGEEDGEYFYTHFDNFVQLEQSTDQIYLLHSEDDFVVPFDHVSMWAEMLPKAELITFIDRNHFLQEDFPELIDLIRQ